MRARLPLSLLVVALAVASACKDPKPDESCSGKQLGEACAVAADCCSGACANDICITQPCAANGATCAAPSDCCAGMCNGGTCGPACPAAGTACTVASDCCHGCENQTCLIADPYPLDTPCTANEQCATGYCSLTSPRVCATPPQPPCLDAGATCTSATAELCCSALCDPTGHCLPKSPICNEATEPCDRDEDCCSLNCVNAGAAGASCGAERCRKVGASCGAAGDCCSGICTGGACQPLPPGPTNSTCTPLGEACAYGSDCCSKNCDGATGDGTVNGTCQPSAWCNAPGDVCDAGSDCCSGLCAAPAAAGQPGRCDDAPGSCAVDGYPCTSDSNCCNKKCEDLGTGTTVCARSDGCRMNGDYCDSDAACCNINSLIPTSPSQWVHCDPVEHICDNGGSCNPPGDICGYKASQDCCFGKKDVCKPDSSGIMRCFGGPPQCCNETGCTGCCTTGWDPYDPLCCIPEENECQFHDQCCGGAPCVPDPTGVLRCAPLACKPRGMACAGASDTSCCQPDLSCQNVPEIGWICTGTLPPPECTVGSGGACSPGTTAPCCVSPYSCTTAPGSTTGTCALCAPDGNSCASDGDCCSAACSGNVCVRPCEHQGGSCTADSDCCQGEALKCEIPGGGTGGTCVPGNACVATNDSGCSATVLCCDPSDVCGTDGFCRAACRQPTQACTAVAVGGQPQQGECCNGLLCYEQDPATGARLPCAAGASCFCDSPSCAAAGQACSTLVDCCPGTQTYCAANGGSGAPCTSADPSQCTCVTTGG